MSRQIKFQAYDCKTNEMITWDEINEIDELGFVPFVDMLRTPERYKMRQFTGLRDRNGKEIYEGDIVKTSWYNEPLEVIYLEYEFLLRVQGNANYNYAGFDNFDSSQDFEVIGNIYEDSHLLKGEEADDH